MGQSLTIDFNANLARFTSAIDKATSDLSKFQTNAQRMSANLSRTFAQLGAGLSVGAFGAMIKGAIDSADAMNDLSQKVGISVKDLSKYELASKQSGTTLEAFSKGIKGLSGNMVEHGDALRKAGITATDADGALRQLADLFKNTPDDVEKTTLAVKLFGKAGMDMIPMLNLGSEGLEKSAKSAARYAEIMQALAPGADRFNDQLAELNLNSSATAAAFAANVTPTLNNFLEQMIEGTRIAGGFGAALVQFGTINPFKDLATNIRETREELQKFQSGKPGILWFGATEGEIARKRSSLEKDYEFLKMMQRQNLPQADYSNEGWGHRTDRTMQLDAIKKRMQLIKDLGGMGSERAASTADLDRMKKLGVSNQTAVIDSEEEMRILAEKRNAQDALAAFEGLQRMLKLGQENELAAYYATAGEEMIRETVEQQNLNREIAAMNEKANEAKNFARDMGMSFSSAFEDAVIGGNSLRKVLQGLLNDILRIALRKTMTVPLGSAIGGMFSNFSLGDLFRAEGGPVSGGQSYIVGERGPEIFTPMSSGNITPNNKIGGTSNHFTIDMRGASMEAVARLEQLVMSVNGSIERRAVSAAIDSRRRTPALWGA